MKKSAILYHYPCPDGAFAALAAHIYFSHFHTCSLVHFFPNTVYSPLTVDDLPIHDIDHVYLLDFVGPPGFVQQLSTRVQNVVVLDHHKTALQSLGSVNGNITKVIDMNRSAATIAYDYFINKLIHKTDRDQFTKLRKLFEYIEDADLWKWNLPNSKAFSSGFNDLNMEFDVNSNPSLFQHLLSLDCDVVIRQGLSSLAHKQKIIHEVLQLSYEIGLGDEEFGRCLAVDADSVSELRSEVGHQLALKSLEMNLRGIGAVVYQVPGIENDLMLKISLRSLEDEDTSKISQRYGGGGHRNASSFMLSSAEFQKWRN